MPQRCVATVPTVVATARAASTVCSNSSNTRGELCGHKSPEWPELLLQTVEAKRAVATAVATVATTVATVWEQLLHNVEATRAPLPPPTHS